jgi:hypothetical protein
MITSREIRELLKRNPQHLYYLVSSILDHGLVKDPSNPQRGAWLGFEIFIGGSSGWAWSQSHGDYITWFGGDYSPEKTRHRHFTHRNPVAYTRRLIMYAFKLGYPIEASLCAAALHFMRLWELPLENHVPVRR